MYMGCTSDKLKVHIAEHIFRILQITQIMFQKQKDTLLKCTEERWIISISGIEHMLGRKDEGIKEGTF